MNIRVYADTSVFGGIYDNDFQKESKEFFDEVKKNRFTLVTSAVVRAEIEPAPEKVKIFFEELIKIAEIVDVSKDALELRDAYLKAGILTPKYSDDALHVALASVSNCTLIISWNFKHIVHFEKIPLYNAVNILNGYSEIKIFSPLEVIQYDEED